MSVFPKTTLEQWCLLDAVIRHGSFARAAQALYRSQSAVSYGIARLQEQLGVPLLEIQGRRAVLTETGRVLLEQARPLIEDMLGLEQKAVMAGRGWESEVRLAVDSIFPRPLLFEALRQFRQRCGHTRLVIHEVILSGADEALVSGEADLIIGSRVPLGYQGEVLYTVCFLPVAHPEHPLHHAGRALSMRDLSRHVHVVIRDSGRSAPRSEGWQGARERWTVSSLEASVAAVSYGMGFAWLPEHAIAGALAEGRLRVLPLLNFPERSAALYMIRQDSEQEGPGVRQLESCLREVAAAALRQRLEAPTGDGGG